MEIQTPIVKRGKLVVSGASLVVTLPKEWIQEHDLKAGEEVMIVSNGDIRIMKITEENAEKIRNQLSHSSQSVVTDSQNDKAAAGSG